MAFKTKLILGKPRSYFIPHSSMSKRAQSAMEFLILMGFLTFIIVGILAVGYFYSSTINDRIEANQVNNFANKIISTAETVFYAGEPSKSTISAHLPENIKEIEIANNTIIITYNLASGENKIAFPSNVPIVENSSSQITTTSGLKNIIIIANQTHAIISQN